MKRSYEFQILLLLIAVAAGSLAQSNPSPSQQTVRIGVAVTANRSGRQTSPIWERDQLLRELQRLGKNRKSPVVIEAVALDASKREDAATEAEKKNCRYFVLTSTVDARQGPGVSNGPDGIAPAPVMIGNGRPSQTLAIDFTLLEVNDSRTVAEGVGTGPVEERNDTRAADEAMRMVAHQVAGKLREHSPPKIN